LESDLKPLAAVLLTAATVAALAVPAEAAVPQHKKPTETVACGKKTAEVWNTGSLVAAKNPCGKWLVIMHSTTSQSNPNTYYLSVTPGAHFNIANLDWLDGDDPGTYDPFFVQLAPAHASCGDLYAKNSHGKATYLGGCPDW
jgi:hypothetical protein